MNAVFNKPVKQDVLKNMRSLKFNCVHPWNPFATCLFYGGCTIFTSITV